MNYLVTGGAGFIGSHLAEYLTSFNHKVTILDNLSTGSLTNLIHCKDFKFINGDILNKTDIENAIQGCDWVIHLAAAVGVKLVTEKPAETFKVNMEGTINVLESSLAHKARVFLASTSETYGKSVKVPFKEDDDRLIGPTNIIRWGYATSKIADEYMAMAYYKEKRLPVIIGRFFNTVGPRQVSTYGMVIPRLVEQAIKGQDLTIYGDGKQTRCFGSVDDAVAAIYKLTRSPKAIGQVVNIGNEEEVQIKELAKRVINLTGSKSKIKFIPFSKVFEPGFEDMQRRVPDTAKLKKLTGFAFSTKLDQIIKSVIASMQIPVNPVAPIRRSYKGNGTNLARTGVKKDSRTSRNLPVWTTRYKSIRSNVEKS